MRKMIEKWMRAAIGKEPNEYYDIHIDEIDARYAEQSQWLSGAAECLRVAAELRDSVAPSCDVAVAIGLTAHTHPQGADFVTWHDVSGKMEWSPPSLYVAKRGVAPWAEDSDCHEISVQGPFPDLDDIKTRLCEWFDENDQEYRRSLWLIL